MLDASKLPDIVGRNLSDPRALTLAAHGTARDRALCTVFRPSIDGFETHQPVWYDANSVGDVAVGNGLVGGNAVGGNAIGGVAVGGVHKFEPESDDAYDVMRHRWAFVTSGLSQPDVDCDGDAEDVTDDSGQRFSGMGIELVITTATDVNWPAIVLTNMVRRMLQDQSSPLVIPGDVFRGAIGPATMDHHLRRGTDAGGPRNLLATIDNRYENEILLPAGQLQLIHLVAITDGEVAAIDAEVAASKLDRRASFGGEMMSALLRDIGPGMDSQLDRSCLTTRDDFQQRWRSARSTVESTWSGDLGC